MRKKHYHPAPIPLSFLTNCTACGVQFRYADSVDYLLMFFGTLFAIGAGVNQQLTFYFLSRVLDLYIFANASK